MNMGPLSGLLKNRDSHEYRRINRRPGGRQTATAMMAVPGYRRRPAATGASVCRGAEAPARQPASPASKIKPAVQAAMANGMAAPPVVTATPSARPHPKPSTNPEESSGSEAGGAVDRARLTGEAWAGALASNARAMAAAQANFNHGCRRLITRI